MVFRLCLCVGMLFAGGYANNTIDYCRFLVIYDTFKTSVDQFLTSGNENCGNTEREITTTSLETTDKRIYDLENTVEKLLNDTENEKVRLESVERALANLTSDPSVDCGSPTPPEGTDVDYSSTGLHAIANYRCKKGFLNTQPGQEMKSLCQKDWHWTVANVSCVNISGCWTVRSGSVLYTGTLSTTTTGKVCQRWDSQTPHAHVMREDKRFRIPEFDSHQTAEESANYCRDADNSGMLWCFTTDEDTRWEKCDVPKCNI